MTLAFTLNTHASDFAFWLIVAVAVIALYRHVRAVIRRRRARDQRCVACGYDRRGLQPGTPCPECEAPWTPRDTD